MATTPIQRRVIKFGVFEVDLAGGEVRKAGMKQKLAGQPFQVLQALLEKTQEIVTREELRERLWPNNTFVDYELALRKAVNRLREVLGDSAENPRFIETVPRKGYRFLTPLNGTDVAAMLDSAAIGAEPGKATASAQVSAGTLWKSLRGRRSGLRYTFLVVAILVVGAVIGYAAMWHLPPPRITGSTQLSRDGLAKTASYVNELPSPLVSDGSQLYFVECAIGATKLAQASTRGGETTLFPAGFRVRRVLDVSPKRHELLALSYDRVQMESPVMVVPLPAGTPHRLGDVLAHDASWSPDGKRLVYASGQDLYVSKEDGSDPHKLVTV